MRISLATVLAIGVTVLVSQPATRRHAIASTRRGGSTVEARPQPQHGHARATRDASGHRPQDRRTDSRVPDQERQLQADRRPDERERHRREELPQAEAARRRSSRRPTRRPVTEARGAALIDIIVATSICVLMAAIAVPVIGGTLDRERTIVGARYLAGQLQRARLESLKRARPVAVRVEVIGDRTQLRLFADGNGNGVLQHDIDHGIDLPLTPMEWLDDQARDISLRINQDVTDVSGVDDARARRRSVAHRQHVAPDLQSRRQCDERHALRRGSSGSTNGDSRLRSDRSCPRADVRCADAAMASLVIDLIERRRERRTTGAGPHWQRIRHPSSRSAGHAPQHQQSRGARRIGRAAASWRAHRDAARGIARARAAIAWTARSLPRRRARADSLSRRAGVRRARRRRRRPRRRSTSSRCPTRVRRQGTCYSHVATPAPPSCAFPA